MAFLFDNRGDSHSNNICFLAFYNAGSGAYYRPFANFEVLENGGARPDENSLF